MTPLRIEFEIDGPVYPQAHPLHLDSLVASQMVLSRADPPDADELQKILANLPFEKALFGSEWVWKASAVQFEWDGLPSHESWTMKIDPADLYRLMEEGVVQDMKPTSKIDMARGPLKAGQGVHECRWAKTAHAWAVGDKDRLQQQLETLHQIGTKRRLGAGRVRRVSIVEDPEALTRWASRYLPAAAKLGIAVEGALRPPYFARDQQQMVLNNLQF